MYPFHGISFMSPLALNRKYQNPLTGHSDDIIHEQINPTNPTRFITTEVQIEKEIICIFEIMIFEAFKINPYTETRFQFSLHSILSALAFYRIQPSQKGNDWSIKSYP